MSAPTLKAPFPWFGGKSRVADVVWRAFGDVPNYVEPFAGSLAVLLGRPHEGKIETVNDLDCVAPNTRLLRADMSWSPAGEISVGDWLLAFDETNGPAHGPGLRAPTKYRRFAHATVTGVRRIVKPCYRLTFDDGTVVTSSADHLWLGGSHKSGGRGWRWVKTSSLVCDRDTQRSWILKVCDVVEREDSFDAGWLSGILDGEGHVNAGPGLRVSFSQNEGAVLDRACGILASRGISATKRVGGRDCKSVIATGGKHQQLALLMRFRPGRLIKNFMADCHDVSLYGRDHRAVGLVSKEFVGEQEVMAIETDARTYIAEGLASHNCYLANFWRAVQADPEGVAAHADWPVNEADLHARHEWLVQNGDFRNRMHAEPEFCDVRVAGWWIWGICQWIGSGWCDLNRKEVSLQMPAMGTTGGGARRGVHSQAARTTSQQIPVLSSAGMDAHAGGARMPALGHSGRGIHSPERAGLIDWFGRLQTRLRRTRVACGDWKRILSGSVTGASNTLGNMGMQPCGVFLDPPYEGETDVYGLTECVSQHVREWAVANGDNRALRIALCGYAGEHPMPAGWVEHAWKAQGGYGNRNGEEANENARRERIWFSPHCLPLVSKQVGLFERTGTGGTP